MRIYNKWWKEIWWWALENLELVGFILLIAVAILSYIYFMGGK